MKYEYHFHIHQQSKAIAFVRLREDGELIWCCLGEYPQEKWKDAMTWFQMYLAGDAMCSEYEWSPLKSRDDYNWFREVAIPDVKDVRAFVKLLFEAPEAASAMLQSWRAAGGAVQRGGAAE